MGYSVYQSQAQAVTEAKQKLRQTSNNLDYLAPIKDNPTTSVTVALLAGFITGHLVKGENATSKSLLNLAMLAANKIFL